jgi:hypothetical protein
MSAFTGLTTDRIAGATGRVQQAIATASRRTGVDFGYLMGQARIESSMNPTARAPTSSATGLYQFIDQSWLAIVNDHGAKYGMGWASDAIQKTGSGRYHVTDPAMRQQILDLRNHPETASVMAAELASDNRSYLEERIGRPAQSVDLYLAHFLGAGGAAKFLTTMAAAPDTKAASLFPAAARANEGIFYDQQGNARSFASIRDHFAGKLARGGSVAGGASGMGVSGGSDLPANAKFVQPADYLRIARQQLDRGERSGMEASSGGGTATATGALAAMARRAAMDALAGADGAADGNGLSDMDLLAAIGPNAAIIGQVTASTGGDGTQRPIDANSSAAMGALWAMRTNAATGGAAAMNALAGHGASTALAAMGRMAGAGPLADADDPSGSAMLPGLANAAGMATLPGHAAASAMGTLAGIVPAAGADNFSIGDALAGQQLLAGRQTSPDLMPRAEAARLAYLMLATFGR